MHVLLCRVCIVSYDMVKKLGSWVEEYQTVIADESHHLKVTLTTSLPI